MFSILRNKKAQNTAEYAILIGLVVAAVMAMQTYVKRSLQSGVKTKVDALSSTQYEPAYLESSYDTTVAGYTDTEETKIGGKVERAYSSETAPKVVTRTGYQKIKNASQ